MATSALLIGGAYVAGTMVHSLNNQKKEEVLQKFQRQKIKLLEDRMRWLEIKSKEEKRYRRSLSEIEALKQKICNEEKAISQYDQSGNDDERTKFMVVLGNTGDGKSTLCNRLSGDASEYGDRGPFMVSDDAQSQTKQIQIQHCRSQSQSSSTTTDHRNNNIIVDTPGINDSEQKDDSHINDLVHYLYGCGGVNAFILARNGTNYRFDANFQRMLQQYEQFFSHRFWQHLIIVLTRIEGTEKQRFSEKKGAQQLQQNLQKTFNLKQKMKTEIPVFVCGTDCYRECVTQIKRALQTRPKFECKDLTSPIDEFREELGLLMDSMDDFGSNLIEDAEENITRIDMEIAKTEIKMENPSQIPLLKSAVKSVNKSMVKSLHGAIHNYYKASEDNEQEPIDI